MRQSGLSSFRAFDHRLPIGISMYSMKSWLSYATKNQKPLSPPIHKLKASTHELKSSTHESKASTHDFRASTQNFETFSNQLKNLPMVLKPLLMN